MKKFLLPQTAFFIVTLILIAMCFVLNIVVMAYAFCILSVWALVSIFIAKNYSALGITTVIVSISMIVIFNLEPVLGIALFLFALPILIILSIIGLLKEANRQQSPF